MPNLLPLTVLPYFNTSLNILRGKCFCAHQRITIDDVYKKGSEKLKIIGNHCIELKKHHFQESPSKLHPNDFVLAADFNVGANLIRISNSGFNSHKFQIFFWRKCPECFELQTLFGRRNSTLLSCFNDFSIFIDFKKLIRKLPSSEPFRIFFFFLFLRNPVVNNLEKSGFSFKIFLLKLNKRSPYSYSIQVYIISILLFLNHFIK